MHVQPEELILNDLPVLIKDAVCALSVSTSLNDEIATQLLKNTSVANGNARDIIAEVKSLPLTIQRNRNYWSIAPKIREVALQKLNGSKQKYQLEAFKILKSQHIDYSSNAPYIELRDFELQTMRLGLKIPDEQQNAIQKLRSIFEADEEYNNHDNTKVLSLYIDEGITFKESEAYPAHILSAYFIRGIHAYRTRENDYSTALKYFLPVWKFHDQSYSSKKDAAIASHLIGLIYSKKRYSFNDVFNTYKDSIALAEEIKFDFHLGHVYHSLGNLYSKDRAKAKEAEQVFNRSIDIRIQINDYYGLAQVYHSLGNLYGRNRTTFKEAGQAFKKSIDIRIQINDYYGLAQVYHSFGNLYSKDTTKFKEAESAFIKSISIGETIKDNYTLAQVYHSLGNLYSKDTTKFKEAENALIKSISIGEIIKDKLTLAQVYHSLGNLLSKEKNRFADAENAYKKSLEIEKANNNKYGLAQVYHSLGNLLSKEKNRLADAENAYKKSLEIEIASNNKYGLAQVYSNYGKLKALQHDYKRAKELFEDALKYQTDPRYIRMVKELIRELPI